jgi:cyanophycinase
MHCRNFAVLAALVALLATSTRPIVLAGDSAATEEAAANKSKMTAAANVLGLPSGAIAGGGTLMVCGGGSLPDEVYDEFVKLAGGDKAKIILIPSAYPYDSLASLQFRFSGWLGYTTASFDFLHASTREQADSDEFAKPLEEATGVWFSGGDQARLTDLYRGTKVEQQLQKLLERGGVIGGTSAGAAVMSQTMIKYGTAREAVLDEGFNFLSGAVVDQHFTQRGRHTRLLGVLGQNPNKIGIGVDENTCVVIRANHVRVMGDFRATVIVPSAHRTMSLHVLDSGEEAELIRQEDKEDTPFKLMGLAKK